MRIFRQSIVALGAAAVLLCGAGTATATEPTPTPVNMEETSDVAVEQLAEVGAEAPELGETPMIDIAGVTSELAEQSEPVADEPTKASEAPSEGDAAEEAPAARSFAAPEPDSIAGSDGLPDCVASETVTVRPSSVFDAADPRTFFDLVGEGSASWEFTKNGLKLTATGADDIVVGALPGSVDDDAACAPVFAFTGASGAELGQVLFDADSSFYLLDPSTADDWSGISIVGGGFFLVDGAGVLTSVTVNGVKYVFTNVELTEVTPETPQYYDTTCEEDPEAIIPTVEGVSYYLEDDAAPDGLREVSGTFGLKPATTYSLIAFPDEGYDFPLSYYDEELGLSYDGYEATTSGRDGCDDSGTVTEPTESATATQIASTPTATPTVPAKAGPASSGNLPNTGFDGAPLVWAGCALVLAGGALALVRRRLRQQ